MHGGQPSGIPLRLWWVKAPNCLPTVHMGRCVRTRPSSDGYGTVRKRKLQPPSCPHYSVPQIRRLSSVTYGSGCELPRSSLRKPDVDIDDEEALEYHKEGDKEDEEQERIYEVTENYKHIRLNQPIQIPFFVYQYAKMKMLQFYYDLLDHYLVHRKLIPYVFRYGQYVPVNFRYWPPGFGKTSANGRVLPGRVYHCNGSFQNPVKNTLPTSFRRWSPEDHGPGADKNKMSCKGIQKSRNLKTLTYQRYKDILASGENGGGVNIGFRFEPSTQRMYT